MKELYNMIKSLFCKHKNVPIYVYGTFSQFRCVNCGKYKKGFTPVAITEGELANNRIYFKKYFK